jgi:hypothetical protein
MQQRLYHDCDAFAEHATQGGHHLKTSTLYRSILSVHFPSATTGAIQSQLPRLITSQEKSKSSL